MPPQKRVIRGKPRRKSIKRFLQKNRVVLTFISIYDHVFRGRGREWRDTFLWLFYTIFGGFLPIWGGWIGLRVYSQQVTPETFTKNGELAIYSASMLAASLYLITRKSTTGLIKDLYYLIFRGKGAKSFLFPGQSCLSLIIYGLSGLASLLFAFNLTRYIPNSLSSQVFDTSFLLNASIVIFVISFLLSLLVVLIDNFWSPRGHETQYQDEYKEIDEDFSELGRIR